MIGAKTASIGNPHRTEYCGLPESKCAGASHTSCARRVWKDRLGVKHFRKCTIFGVVAHTVHLIRHCCQTQAVKAVRQSPGRNNQGWKWHFSFFSPLSLNNTAFSALTSFIVFDCLEVMVTFESTSHLPPNGKIISSGVVWIVDMHESCRNCEKRTYFEKFVTSSHFFGHCVVDRN